MSSTPPPTGAATPPVPMTPAPEDVVQLGSLLTALTQPHTETIRQAELALKPLLKDPRCIPALLEIIKAKDAQPPAVRHVAAILLRKRLPGHYAKFDETAPPESPFLTKALVKTELLSILATEPDRNVRNGVAGVAASLGNLECGPGGTQWPELFQFIAAAAAVEAPPEARELAFQLLQEMTETVGTHLKPQFSALAGLFGTALNTPATDDAHRVVQKSCVKALGQLLSFLSDEPEVEVFGGLIPPILHVANHCRQVHDEDTVAVVLDVLYDLAYSPSPIVASHLNSMVQFSLECLKSHPQDPALNLEMGIRDQAALVVATLAEAKPKTFGKDEAMVGQVLDTLFELIEQSPASAAGALFDSNPAWRHDLVDDHHGGGNAEHPDQSNPMDSPTETSMSQGTLDMLACELPKKYIFEPAVSRCLQRLSSPHASHRKAGIACLGVIAEGCAEPLREQLPLVMSHVLQAAQDGSSSQVRECACFCLGQLSEHCQPDILSYAPQLLPVVFALLDDATVAVQATSCYVLEMFCERLEPSAVRPFLDSLVRKLAAMLEGTTKRSVQEMAVAALAATAVAAEEEFAPYVGGVATLMNTLMQLQEERLFSLRGRALECMGHMAIAVGAETFRPYFAGTMQCALDGLAKDSTDLQEFAYAVFANLAKVMKEEFAPVLNDLVPHLCEVIGADEGQLEPAPDDEAEKAGEFTALDDSDDEDDEDREHGNYILHVRTALLEVKKGAITAIGEMAAHTGAAFCPHLEAVMLVLQKAAHNWHPLIKSEVADALPSLVVPSISAYHEGQLHWEKGADTNAVNPMSEHTNAIVSAVLAELVALMKDDDKTTVGKACGGIQSVIESCGCHALLPVAQDCLKNTHDLLTKSAPCQMIGGEEFGVDAGDGTSGGVGGGGGAHLDEDDDDHDVVMQAACDLVGALCRVMGGVHFAPYLPDFLKAVCEYAKSSRPPNDRSMAMGCLSEMAQELEQAILPHWQTVFFPAICAGLSDPDDNVQRNAAFCTGICCEHLREHVVDQYPALLQALSPLFTKDVNNPAPGSPDPNQQGNPPPSSLESTAACVDNAAAALARMIMASPNHVPLEQVIPAFLTVLPLKTDMTENETVYTCLLGLLQVNPTPNILVQQADQLRRIFTQATGPGSLVEQEIQDKLSVALQAMGAAS